MDRLSFLREIKDIETRADYVQLLHRITKVVIEEDADEWRASWPFPPKSNRRPWIPAKTGYLNKLEDEQIINRQKISNSTSVYSLQEGVDDLLQELEKYQHLLDDENPVQDLEL